MRLLSFVAASALLIGATSAASAYPARIWVPCQYPHGWNSTDASREVWGVPNGMNHRCLVDANRYRLQRGWSWRDSD